MFGTRLLRQTVQWETPHWNFLSCSFIRKGTSLCSTRSNPPSADVSAASIASKDRRYGALGEGDADLDSSAEPPSSDADS